MSIFTNKKLSYLLITLTLVLVLLVCIMLTYLSQIASVTSELARLDHLIAQQESINDRELQRQEYIKSYEYVRDWALANGFIDKDDVEYFEEK